MHADLGYVHYDNHIPGTINEPFDLFVPCLRNRVGRAFSMKTGQGPSAP